MGLKELQNIRDNRDVPKEKKRYVIPKISKKRAAQIEKEKTAMANRSRTEKKQIKQSVRTSVRSLVSSEGNKEVMERDKSKSELLKEADRVFSLYIRKRDSDKNGNVACVCCGKIYNIEDKDRNGDRIIQNLHFVKREIYSRRFDEYMNCYAGCTYCNKDMSDNSKGNAYQQYRDFLVSRFGETEIALMELEHRKINRIEAVMLKNIIEHYSNN